MEGIARYIYETTRRMVLSHPEDEFHFFFDRPYDDKFIFADNVTAHILRPPARHPLLWYLWFEWSVPRRLKKIQADVFLSGDMYLSLKTKVPTIMVSHDLNYEHYGEFLRWSHQKFMAYYSPRYHRKAEHLISVSQATKSDIINTYNLPSDRISVAHNSTPEGFAPILPAEKKLLQQKFTNEKPYFIYVGSLHPRKNVKKLLLAFDLFLRETKRSHKLIIYGRAAFKTGDIFRTYEKMKHKDAVVFLNDQDVAIAKILAGAEALCYLSLFEGFGIPILEALASDVPVLTSNVSSMPEVAGPAALLVNPNNIKEIAQGMNKLCADKNLRERLIRAGQEQIKKFSWQKSSEIIYKQLHTLAKAQKV